MKIRWTKPIPVEKLLEQGGKCGEFLPEKTGIYRFQVVPENKVLPGEVVYIGKVGGGRGDGRHIRRRIGEFIGAALGFGIPHSGGITFWEDGNKHKLWVQDLEVCFYPTEDPACAEVVAFQEFREKTGRELPRMNKRLPSKKCSAHCR
jgi:hypothetical protein